MSINILKIPLSIILKMKHHVQANFPYEACGFLAGTDHKIQIIETVANSLRSPTEFRMEPEDQLRAMMKIEHDRLEILAIFHSHPAGPSHPSQTDIRLHYDPETLSIILSPAVNDWEVRCFIIKHNEIIEIPIDILTE